MDKSEPKQDKSSLARIVPGSREAHELAPLRTHGPIYDGLCPICTDPRRLVIEQAHQDCDSQFQLMTDFQLDPLALKMHIRALDLDVQRLDRTDKAMAKIQEIGFQRLEQGLTEVNADHLIRMSEHKDKKEGRVVQRVAITKPSVIVFRGIPSPVETLEEAEDVVTGCLADDGLPLVPMLPSKVTVKEPTNE